MEKTDFSSFIKDSRLAKLEMLLVQPNIFSVLRIEKSEIRHSNFLAWLLDPKEGHNLGDRFLRWFLRDVFSDEKISWMDEFRVDSIDLNKVIVLREFRNIDLLVMAEDFVILVENKILSGEHDDQLKKYRTTVDVEFPGRHHAFVFLTLEGEEPIEIEDNDVYVNYSYAGICSILENILSVYSPTLSQVAKQYIEDYTSVLRRHVMQDDEAIRISQEIYRSHRNVIDFILENRPDRLLEFMPIAVEAIKECGYVPGSQNKGYARFLTTNISSVVPRTSIGGWKGQEAFLFEVNMWSKSIVLKTVIAPGEEKLRNTLRESLLKVPGGKSATTLLWNTIHSRKKAINVQDDKYADLNLLKEDFKGFLIEQKTFIEQVSKQILADADKLGST